MKLRERAALLRLGASAPAMTHDNLRKLRAELIGLQTGEHSSRALAGLVTSGSLLLAAVCADRAEAIEYVADAKVARELAKRYRRYAMALEDGADRVDTAVRARLDRTEIIAEANRAAEDALKEGTQHG